MSSRISPPAIPRGGSKGRVKARPPPIPRGAGMRNIERDAERKFQLRNEFDAVVEVEERNLERRRNAEFQERRRQTGLTSREIAEARAIGRERSEDIRALNKAKFDIKKQLADPQFSKELMKEGVSGRQIGGQSVELANALFGGAGLEKVASTIGDRGRQREREREIAIKHTAVKPRPQPTPEPAPEPEPEGVKGKLLEGKLLEGKLQQLIKTEVRGNPEPEPEPERIA